MGKIQKLLIVDDEPQIREIIGELVSESYTPILAANGEEALLLAKKKKPDLILLDIMMPGLNGIEVCEKLRQSSETQHIPVIMLSAASHLENRIRSFDLGADDFISKPFDTEELLSRIRSKLKRRIKANTITIDVNRLGNLLIDTKNFSASINAKDLKITPLEFEILKILVEKQSQLVKREEFVKRVWKGAPGSERLIDAHIVTLRKQLENFNGDLKTVYGKGYILSSKDLNTDKVKR